MKYVKIEERQSGVKRLIINRSEKRNALSQELLRNLLSSIHQLESDSTLRALVIKGEGDHFCSGLDLNDVKDEELRLESLHLLASIVKHLTNAPFITIAQVQGCCFAGGGVLMAASDYVVADQGARFGFPEVKRGIVPSLVVALLSNQLSNRDLKRLLFFCELIDAEHALKIGLIDEVVDSSSIEERVAKLCSLVKEGAPLVMRETKKIMNGSLEAKIEKALEFHHRYKTSDEALEGVQAFLEKREPSWVS